MFPRDIFARMLLRSAAARRGMSAHINKDAELKTMGFSCCFVCIIYDLVVAIILTIVVLYYVCLYIYLCVFGMCSHMAERFENRWHWMCRFLRFGDAAIARPPCRRCLSVPAY